MRELLSELIVYSSIRKDEVIRAVAWAESEVSFESEIESAAPSVLEARTNCFYSPMGEMKGESYPESPKCLRGKPGREELRARLYDAVHRIMEVSTKYGLESDLWSSYISWLIATDENPLALVSEQKGLPEGSALHFARHDFHVIRQLMRYDFSALDRALGTDCMATLKQYHAIRKHERMYFSHISETLNEFSRSLRNARSDEEFECAVSDFYRKHGVGLLGLNRAFRIIEKRDGTPELVPINNLDSVRYSDLVGYENQKNLIRNNTRAFVEGRAANNVLLYGDAGTGKSTTIKATLNEFSCEGLRLIEIYKHQFRDLSFVISAVKTRNYRFIIYMDDLSFEDFETEYKYLKAVIEGGFETRPDNILIYATSNRRHLIKENVSDRDDQGKGGDVHHSDTVEEKLSLVDRFGLSILYTRPSFEEYHRIVRNLAEKYGIDLPEQELLRRADAWSIKRGAATGRSAQQFINSLNPVRN